ncbi:MAG TPA: hypothetical protein VFV74_12910 [Burkholderiales bacterium]|nr:hypothetical protein [Burkholderiales bacterium]
MSHDFRSVRLDEADLWRRRTYALAALAAVAVTFGIVVLLSPHRAAEAVPASIVSAGATAATAAAMEPHRGGSPETNAAPARPPMDCEMPGADLNDCVFY